MATNFLWNTGTSNNGLITSALDLATTELNSLTSGSYVISSVGGASGVFTNSNTAAAMWAVPVWTWGGTLTPGGNVNMSCWFAESLDGSTFEDASNLLARAPDIVFAFSANSYTSGKIVLAQGRICRVPALKFKVITQNNVNGTLPSSGNKVTLGLFAEQY